MDTHKTRWLLAVALLFIAFVIFTYHKDAKDSKHYHFRRITVATAKNFYNYSLSYFADDTYESINGKKIVTSDGPPNFKIDTDVIISGGPMMDQGGAITYEKPFIFRYRNKDLAVILKADGDVYQCTDASPIGTDAHGSQLGASFDRLYGIKQKIDRNVLSADQIDKEVDFVINTLRHDGCEWMRVEAAKMLGVIKRPKSVEPLLGAIKDDKSREVLDEVLKALVAMSNPRIGDVLIAIAGDKTISVWNRRAAVEALGKIEDPRAVEPLAALLEEKDICLQVTITLGEIKDPGAIEPLIAASTDCGTTRALGNFKDPNAVDALISRLHDPNWRIRQDAAFALGKIKDPRAVEPLIATLGDAESTVQGAAATALASIKDPRSCFPLYEALTDDIDRNRFAAARALAAMKDEPIAMELLDKAAKDQRPDVRRAASLARGIRAPVPLPPDKRPQMPPVTKVPRRR